MTTKNKTDQVRRREIAAIKAVVFFDLFNYPLTDWEVWQYAKEAGSFSDFRDTLTSLVVKKALFSRQGYYFLPGREELIAIRRERYNYTNHKIKLARRAIRLFKWLPTVKLVAVSNLIGHHNLRLESDIDLFIVSRDGYLWLTRLFCTGLMKLVRKRPTADCKQDKMCLSFYSSLSGSALEPLRLKPEDPYFEYWLLDLFTIYDREHYFDLLSARNLWLRRLFPNNLAFDRKLPDDPPVLEKTAKSYLSDRLAKSFQLAIMPAKLKDLAVIKSGVILNDRWLRFYLNDRREEFRQKYYDQLIAGGIYEKI